jgi:hypothetical protein
LLVWLAALLSQFLLCFLVSIKAWIGSTDGEGVALVCAIAPQNDKRKKEAASVGGLLIPSAPDCPHCKR